MAGQSRIVFSVAIALSLGAPIRGAAQATDELPDEIRQDAPGPERAPDVPSAADALVPPPPAAGSTRPPPVAPRRMQPGELVGGPFLDAAESAFRSRRIGVARLHLREAMRWLPEGTPLALRADALRVRIHAMPRQDPPTRDPEALYGPMLDMAEADLSAGRPFVARIRLEAVVQSVPRGDIARRARLLRALAVDATGGGPPIVRPRDDDELDALGAPEAADTRGLGEAVELYITAAAYGGFVGGYVAFHGHAGSSGSPVTYVLTTLGGAGLLAVAVLSLDLTEPRSGAFPTVSAGLRLGFLNGLYAFGLSDLGFDEGSHLMVGFGAAGILAGLALGLGLEPSVADARFVESMALWGGGLGVAASFLSGFEDHGTTYALLMGGLNLGLLGGIAMASAGVRPPLGQTLWLDLGFLAGSGVGVALPVLLAAYSSVDVSFEAFGAGMGLGGISGFVLALLLTELLAVEREESPMQLGLGPTIGGAQITLGGEL